jgi:hypothetical protein
VVKQDQKSIFYNLRKSRSGQAVIEYVLLLVVIVGLLLGSAKIFQTIDKGMQKYIGDYFVCLMEYGELPTLGIGDADLKKHVSGSGRKCDNQFEAFTFENGRPATAGGGGNGSGTNRSNSQNGSAGSGSGSDDGRGGSAGDSASNRNRNSDGSDSDGSSSGSDQAGRGRSGSSSRKPEVKRSDSGFGTLDGGLGEEESKSKIVDEDGDSDSEKDRRKRRRPKKTVVGYADEYRAIGGKGLQELDKQQRRRGNVRKPTSTLIKIADEEGISGPTRKTVTPPQRDVAAEIKDKDSGFSFGSLFKWLLIAGMVVAIIVFFGGQLLNYSNSD